MVARQRLLVDRRLGRRFDPRGSLHSHKVVSTALPAQTKYMLYLRCDIAITSCRQREVFMEPTHKRGLAAETGQRQP